MTDISFTSMVESLMESTTKLPGGLKIDSVDDIKKLMADKLKPVFKSYDFSVKTVANTLIVKLSGELSDKFAVVKTNRDPFIDKYADRDSFKKSGCQINVQFSAAAKELAKRVSDVFESVFGIDAPEFFDDWRRASQGESIACLHHKRENAPDGEWKLAQIDIRGSYEKLPSDHHDNEARISAPLTYGGHIDINVLIG